MTLEQIYKIVAEGGDGMYIVKASNGSERNKYFFITERGTLCMKKRSNAHIGWTFNSYDAAFILKVRKYEGFKPTVKLLRQRAYKALQMLEKSGMWKSLQDSLKAVLKHSDSELAAFIKDVQKDEYNTWKEMYEGGKYVDICTDWREIILNMCKKECFKSIRYRRYDREWNTKRMQAAMRDKEEFSYRWENGYDCSIELECSSEEEGIRGWYSEEYRGCGNGHYYILLDETHAIFHDDD